MTIQWFPGHMAKARRQVTEKLKLIDVVIELLDARLPLSSRNPMIDEIVSDKPRLILLNKSDLADETVTRQWIQYFASRGIKAIPIDALSGRGVNKIPAECQSLMEEMMEKRRAKGMQDRAIRAMIIGIPNVGKSSLMNRLAGRKVAQTGDRPAVTKAQQWVKVGKSLELLVA
jgi:ribosome biogenesis GTPase A